MKKLLIILIVAAVSLSASAQKRYGGYRGGYTRSHVVVAVGSPFYSPYYYGYNPFFNPYAPYNYYPRETRLEVRIADIRSDYKERIWSARHDKKLNSSERKATVHQLKRDRDKAITDAKENYYRTH